jgi:hypothetical protein
MGLVPELPLGDRIPRIIHQTAPARHLAPHLQHNVDRLCAMNPEWEHRLYDDADIEVFIEKTYGKPMLDRYRRIDPRYGAARADLFRYLLLYSQGGVYLDIKSGVRVPLDTLIRPEDRYLLAHWHQTGEETGAGWGHHPDVAQWGGELQQWHIACASGHPFLRAVIGTVLRNLDVYHPLVDGVGFRAVIRVTGPVAYTRAIGPLMQTHPHRLLDASAPAFLYEAATDPSAANYRTLPTHYSRRREPVVRQGALLTAGVTAAFRLKQALMPRKSIG